MGCFIDLLPFMFSLKVCLLELIFSYFFTISKIHETNPNYSIEDPIRFVVVSRKVIQSAYRGGL